MKVAIVRQAGEQTAGVNAGAGEAIGGYRRAASEARAGVEQNYHKESRCEPVSLSESGGRNGTNSC